MIEHLILSESELNDLCKVWQKRLRLQDWDVKVKVLRRDEMPEGEARGCCGHALKLREAAISILDPVDYRPGVWPNDMEQTLVHELLHLYFAPFEAEEDTAEEIAQEQAIDGLACALVILARSTK